MHTFTRKNNPVVHEDLRFVSAAVCKDSTRPNLGGVFIDPDGVAVATDGVRLHYARPVIPFEGLEPGTLYKVKSRTKSKITLEAVPEHLAGRFPNWEYVLPKKTVHIWPEHKIAGASTTVARYNWSMDHPVTLDHGYVDEGLDHSEISQLWASKTYGSPALLRSENDRVGAVIMPIRVLGKKCPDAPERGSIKNHPKL